MIDINIYRRNEELAREELPSWQIRSRHSLEIFEKVGFPTRLNNISQLRQLLDTMSEHLFDSYMDEINGLSEEELEVFLTAAVNTIIFHQEHFPEKDVILPLNNLMQSLIVYTKLNKIPYERVLEIGPGSGIFSFFISQKKDLKNYSQVEACESFYMLQNYINQFLFKSRFKQKALFSSKNTANFYNTDSIVALDVYEKPTIIDVANIKEKCIQYPWWKLGDIIESENYDVILSNANLLEFSKVALLDYLSLINKKLNNQGIFFFHCEGYPGNGTLQDLFEKLYDFEFAPLFFQKGGVYLVEDIDSSTKKIVVAPVGINTDVLLDNKKFTSRFDEIYVLDDNKAGEEFKGCKVISREDIKRLNISEGIILHEKEEIVNLFEDIFKKLNIKKLELETKKFSKSFGVFIKKENTLFNKYYKKENYKLYFNSKEEIIQKIFSVDSLDRNKYNKEEIISLVKKAYERRVNEV